MTNQYCHIVYTFDEYIQHDDYEMFFNDDPVGAVFNKTDVDSSDEKGVWVSIKGITGEISVRQCSQDKYENWIDTGLIEEDLWPNFGFNFHYPCDLDELESNEDDNNQLT